MSRSSYAFWSFLTFYFFQTVYLVFYVLRSSKYFLMKIVCLQTSSCKITVLVYKSLPFRWMSRSFGKLTEVHLPTTLRYYIYSLYAFKTGVNKNEIPLELHDYETLMEFFTRALKPGVRPIASCDIVSPADGTMCHCGMVDNFEIEQVKNVRYSIKKFLGELNTKCEDINKNKIDLPPPYNLSEIPEDGTWEQYKKSILHNPDNELYQCVIYLSPGDYHRFHSPVDWKVNFRRHFCGELFSVNPF
uniref:phosphatidylserine decarboxylase n=1 Tax=Lygus hesperus TaxID=30085 RepID=A0A0K8SNF2_LYGHE